MFGYVGKQLRQWYNSNLQSRTKTCFDGFASSSIPIIKLLFHPFRNIRILWGIFCIIMSVAVFSSITGTVLKYLKHVTVIRLDKTPLTDGIQPPAITVCLDEHRTSQLNRQPIQLNDWLTIPGIKSNCELNGKVTWNSSMHAKSEYFSNSVHFNVSFMTIPQGQLALSVIEQVPNPPDGVCTTFELNSFCFKGTQFWKMLVVTIQLADAFRNLSRRPMLIIHEVNGFPLDNYGRYLYEHIMPAAELNLFYSKSIQTNLNTPNRPCSSKPIKMHGQTFAYDQAACQWKETCRYLNDTCQCLCPIEHLQQKSFKKRPYNSGRQYGLKKRNSNCDNECFREQQLLLMNTSVCPYACITTTYKKINKIVFQKATNTGSVRLVLIQGDAVEKRTEEKLLSLAKLFSEIGGLSSFWFGFSCFVIFELLEFLGQLFISWCIRLKRAFQSHKVLRNMKNYQKKTEEKIIRENNNYLNKLSINKSYNNFEIPYKPHCLPMSHNSPIFQLKSKVQEISKVSKPVNSIASDATIKPNNCTYTHASQSEMFVWTDCEGITAKICVNL